MKIDKVMTPRKDLATVTATATLADVARAMQASDTGIIPVVDAQDHLLGVITDRDITVRAVARDAKLSETRVDAYMSRNLVTVAPDADLDKAASLMADKQVHRLPVISSGKLVGLVSLGDLACVDPEEAEEALEGISHGCKIERHLPH